MGLKETVARVKDAINTLLPGPIQAPASVPTSVLIDYLLAQYLTQTENSLFWKVQPADFEAGREILGLSPEEQILVIISLIERISSQGNYGVRTRLERLRNQLLRNNLPYSNNDLEKLLKSGENEVRASGMGCTEVIIGHVVRYQSRVELTSAMRASLTAIYQAIRGTDPHQRKLKIKIGSMLGISGAGEPEAGEAWADAALAELNAMEPPERAAWEALFVHTATANGGKPSGKWQKEAEKLIEAVGDESFVGHVTTWFQMIDLPPLPEPINGAPPKEPEAADLLTDPRAYDKFLGARRIYRDVYLSYLNRFSEKNRAILKGLAWCLVAYPSSLVVQVMVRMAEKMLQQLPNRVAWSKAAAFAAIWVLGQLPDGIGVASLARLRTRLKDRAALIMISSAIEAAAAKSGMTVDELEDLAVPTGGLGADGTRQETFGTEGSATLTLDGKTGHVSLDWFGADGKPRKAIPASIKKEHADAVKALKGAVAEISQALTAQSARFDKFFLLELSWPLAVWRERYLSHPVLGNLTQRLLWTYDGTPGLPVGETIVDAAGSLLENLTDETIVRLWHPLGSTPQEVMRWRDALESRGIVQPFKQAHREVYLLTDAERNTRTYSNRFAAHILKQHQFNSLCVLRGWKNSLRLMVDADYPPATRELPLHNLRAEFWVEGIGEDYQVDTNETGTYLRVATDQVRFYRPDAPINYAHASGGGYAISRRETPMEPLPLEEVPPLIFSEIMRDVDMFVGVASVGNDPTWADGGPEGRFRNYWQDYAFGDLGESAKTRSDVLARLLPRLKIASRCQLDGKFLTVQGQLRTYKIHLGSGNILMEPNDQYLCIVPSSRASGDEGSTGDLFLPFEGDRMLAIILSKAFLLADDTHITDPTITRQIEVN